MITWFGTPAGGGLTANPVVVSLLDHGFTVGDGVFETIKTIRGRPVALALHLERLANSARLLQIRTPEPNVVAAAIAEVCGQPEAERAPVGRLRVTVTSGAGEPGSARGPGWSLAVVWVPAQPWPATARLLVSAIRRNEHSPLAGAKTTSYAENALALAAANAAGFDEALLLNLAGEVCEGTGCNIFAVFHGEVVTPPLAGGCLPGTTRRRVLELAGREYPTAERAFHLHELLAADEVFITSATRGIQSVAGVGETEFPAPGSVTARLGGLLAAEEVA